MMHSFRQQRHTEREARLCFQVNNVPAAPSTPGQTPEYYMDWLREKAVWLVDIVATETANVGEMIVKFAMSIPPTMLNSLEKAYATFPSRAEIIEQLSRMANFFRDMPEIFTYFPKVETPLDIETVTKLTDHAEWVAAFRSVPGIFTMGVQALPEGAFGPQELLLSLTPEERKVIYMQYIDTFIAPEVQEDMGINNDPKKNPLDRFLFLDEQRPVLNAALGGILGIENFDAKLDEPEDRARAKEIAQKSLTSYYQMNLKPGFVSEGERADYAQALQYQRLAGLTVTATDPTKLMSRIGASRFRGALLNGVIDRERLDFLAGGLKEREHEIRLSTANIRDNLNYYTEATKLEYKKEAETLRQTWDKLGGIEKLILAGALTYGLWKSNTVRIVAGGLVAGYFFQKLVMKEEDPVKKWSALLSGISNPVKGATAATAGAEFTPGYVENVATRSNVIVNFLEDFEMTHLERQAIGFGILHDMPLGALADNFKMDGPDGQEMRLETQDDQFQKKVGDALKKRGWSRTRFDEFFEGSENREQATAAMSYVFFLNAAKVPENRPAVQLIFEALRRCPAGTSLSIFGMVQKDKNLMSVPEDRAIFQRAYEEYVRLVGIGREMAIGSNQTLGDFISLTNGLDMTSSVPIADKARGVSESNAVGESSESAAESNAAESAAEGGTSESDAEGASSESDAAGNSAESAAAGGMSESGVEGASSESAAAQGGAESADEDASSEPETGNQNAESASTGGTATSGAPNEPAESDE